MCTIRNYEVFLQQEKEKTYIKRIKILKRDIFISIDILTTCHRLPYKMYLPIYSYIRNIFLFRYLLWVYVKTIDIKFHKYYSRLFSFKFIQPPLTAC